MHIARYLAVLLFVAGTISPAVSAANEGAHKLARKSGCFNCHSLEYDDIGPAWKRVAEKYRGDAGAEEMLVDKVTRGGKGVWGFLPMPSFAAKLNGTQIRELVQYILALE